MILSERYVVRRKNRYKYWLFIVITAASLFTGIRYGPQILGSFQTNPEEIAKELKKIHLSGLVISNNELSRVIQKLERSIKSKPREIINYLLLGQAYLAFMPDSLDKFIEYYLRRETEWQSINSKQGIYLEKSENYLLKGKNLSKKDTEKRLFRILLVNNYLLRSSFYNQNSKYLLFPGKNKPDYTNFTQKEIEFLLLTSIRQGDISALEENKKNLPENFQLNKEKGQDGTKNYLEAQEYLLKGLTYYFKENFSRAALFIKPYFKQLSNSNTRKGKKYLQLVGCFLGEIYLKLNSLKESEKIAGKLLSDYPDSFGAYLLLGKLYLKKGQNDLAETAFRKSLQIRPELISAKYYLKIASR